MIRFSIVLACLLIAAPLAAQAPDQPSKTPMSFRLVTNDPDAPSGEQKRWVAASGALTQETPLAFDAFLKSHEIAGLTVYLDSGGGSIVGGIRLGEALRKARATVAIGRSTEVGEQPPPKSGKLPRHQVVPARGVCFSACAYAFLGGETRKIHPGAAYGVHMFWPGDQMDGLLSRTYTYSDLERAQRISANIAAYIQRMGVDMQLLQLAASTPPRSAIRRLTAREILATRVATLEFTPATVAGAGQWGVGFEQKQARLVSSGRSETDSKLPVNFSIEATCAPTPGFHTVRVELAPVERLTSRSLAFNRAVLISRSETATLAYSDKDIFAFPARFPRRASDSPNLWIAAGGTIPSAVMTDASRWDGAMRLELQDGNGRDAVVLPVGNLGRVYEQWANACARIQKGGTALP